MEPFNDDEEYAEAQCSKPHKDDSMCIPEWDGYGYVCVYRIVNSETEPSPRP